jgi:hypothetical protein
MSAEECRRGDVSGSSKALRVALANEIDLDQSRGLRWRLPAHLLPICHESRVGLHPRAVLAISGLKS